MWLTRTFTGPQLWVMGFALAVLWSACAPKQDQVNYVEQACTEAEMAKASVAEKHAEYERLLAEVSEREARKVELERLRSRIRTNRIDDQELADWWRAEEQARQEAMRDTMQVDSAAVQEPAEAAPSDEPWEAAAEDTAAVSATSDTSAAVDESSYADDAPFGADTSATEQASSWEESTATAEDTTQTDDTYDSPTDTDEAAPAEDAEPEAEGTESSGIGTEETEGTADEGSFGPVDDTGDQSGSIEEPPETAPEAQDSETDDAGAESGSDSEPRDDAGTPEGFEELESF